MGELLTMTGTGGAPSETREYNSLGQMTRLTQGTVDMRYIYPTSNNNGKIAADYDWGTGETVVYTYDSLNRLASATSSTPNWGQSFGYDGFGNLNNVSVTKGSAPTLSVSYNASTNRRTSDCADASGNISPLRQRGLHVRCEQWFNSCAHQRRRPHVLRLRLRQPPSRT
jgi:hypothetical protein